MTGSVPIQAGGYAIHVLGISELVRNKKAVYPSALDTINEVRPEDTKLVLDDTTRYCRSRQFPEAILRRTAPTDDRIHIGHLGAFNPTHYQLVPARMALEALIDDGV